MKSVRLAEIAMGTRFELVLWGESEMRLIAAGEEALEEILRLEAQLSLYRSDSDIADINRRASEEAVPVEPRLFRLLERAARLTEETEGAFDITVAPLLRCWGFMGGTGEMPTEEAVAEARERVGMQHVLLDAENVTVRFARPGMMLDLGSIGKGYAVECAISLLRENGLTNGLLHGGTSTVYAMGAPPDADAWKVALQKPFETEEGQFLATVDLKDVSLSVSAPHGKWFEANGRRYGHVLDPRTGMPASRSLLSAIVMESATDGDALSTALLTLGADWISHLRQVYPTAEALVTFEKNEKLEIEAEGGNWQVMME